MLVIRAGIHKLLVKIANREYPDQIEKSALRITIYYQESTHHSLGKIRIFYLGLISDILSHCARKASPLNTVSGEMDK